MGLLDEVTKEIESHRAGVPCSVKSALEALPKEDAEALQLLLDKPKAEVPHAALSRVLGKRNLKVPPDQIGKHRRGECCGTR